MSSNAGMINIRRDVKDSFYRYKMPRLVSKIEGKGNGIKTVVSNMVDIAKALARPPAYVTKFFGGEVGSLVICDEKAARYIINGAHEAEKLQNLLDVFIAKFVLCQACENPETDLTVSRDGTIWRNCKACGHRGTVDMAHKLTTFIQKNPPPKPKKVGNDNKGKTSSGDGDSLVKGEGADDDEDEGEETGMAAPEGIDSGFIVREGVEDEDWGDEVDGVAEKMRKEELASLSARVRSALALDNDLADPLDLFGEFLDSNPTISNDKLFEEIEERGLRTDKAVVVLVQCLFHEDFMITFNSRLPLLMKLVKGEKAQKAFLGSVERVVGIHHPSLIKSLPAILQAAYNSDLIDETAIVTWYGHISKRYVSKEVGQKVRQAAAPFVEWLQNAESESEEDEDEDEEDDE